jgi:uncharacterized membrane protein
MTTFTVWKFDRPDAAGVASDMLKHADAEGLVKVLDHATLSWPEGARRPTTKHGHDSTWSGTAWGSVWGLLFGSLFLLPLAGAAVGAGIGALSKTTQGVGIRKEDLERIRAEIVPGTSALFAVTEHGDLDRLAERFHGLHSKLVESNLTDAERQTLLEAFDD